MELMDRHSWRKISLMESFCAAKMRELTWNKWH